jgi:hypothetical protein
MPNKYNVESQTMTTMQTMSWEWDKKKKKEAKVESQTNLVSNDEMKMNVNFF